MLSILFLLVINALVKALETSYAKTQNTSTTKIEIFKFTDYKNDCKVDTPKWLKKGIEKLKNKVYKFLINHLKLSDKHLQNLTHRGFSKASIEEYNYKTMPIKRSAITSSITSKYGSLKGVPGFWFNSDVGWQLATTSGLVIPVRDFNGDIVAIKVRSDSDEAYGKYLTLSTNPKKDKKDKKSEYPQGTAAKTYVHYPLKNKQNANSTLVITEGELKADLTNAYKPDWYCISLPGVAMWEWGVEAAKLLKPRKILLAFDSDKDKELSSSVPGGKPFIVAKSLARLYFTLKINNFDVGILDWDEKFGKGIDDVLAMGGEDHIKIMSEEQTEGFCDKALDGEVPPGWVHVVEIQRFYCLKTSMALTRDMFNDKFASNYEKGKASDKVLRLPYFPQCDRPIYQPNGEKIFEKDGIKYLNLWKPVDIKPVKGDAKLFYDHIAYLLPNQDEQDILLDWLAFNVRHPEIKMNWSILLQGTHGIGKSYLCEVVGLLIGHDNIKEVSNETIKLQWTGYMRNASIVFVHEIMTRGRLDVSNRLKSFITDNTVDINIKGMPLYEQPNIVNFMFFTNHTDSILIESTERRYCVFYSPAIKQEEGYYTRLFKWTKANAGEILYQLQHRDLSNFNPKGHAPHTKARDQLIYETLSPIESWITEGIEEHSYPFNRDVINTKAIALNAPRYVRGATPKGVAKILQKINATSLGQFNVMGSRIRLWCIRNKLKWTNQTPDQIVSEYLNEVVNTFDMEQSLYNPTEM